MCNSGFDTLRAGKSRVFNVDIGRFCVLSLVFLLLSLKVMAFQNKTLTFSGREVSLLSIFDEIKKQTGTIVFYSNELLNDKEKVTVDFKNTSLSSVMTELLKNKPLIYQFSDDYILIKKKPVTASGTKASAVKPQSTATQDTLVTLTGKVMNNASMMGIAGVSVTNVNRNITVVSDGVGMFRIKGKEGDSVRFNFIGMLPVKQPFQKEELQMVLLSSKVEEMREVVITGYQVVDKRTFTGSVGKVDTKLLATAASSDVGKALQGAVAGVAVENSSGTFGTKSKIRIRGNSSISGNQEPLWVVDGIVLDDPVNVNPNQLYSGDAATMLSSAISGINPDDIEDIQILKDASATAMYGTQAVNGVIVVTTKRGKIGSPVVSYKNTFSVGIKPRITQFNVMNSKERMEFSEEMYAKNLIDFTNLNQTYGAYGKLLNQLSKKEIDWDGFYDGIQRAKTYNTDWFDVLFRNSLTQEHSLGVSSGTEKAQYYMSGSYFRDGGQTKGQYTDRYTANLRANYNLSEKFTLTASLYASARNQRMFGAFNSTESVAGIIERDFDINPYTYARTTSRAMRPYADDGSLEFYQTNFAPFNIIHELENNFIDIKAREVKFQLDGKWDIAKRLTYLGIVSGRMTSAYSEHIATEKSNVAESYRAMGSLSIRSLNPWLYDDPYDDSQYPISVLPRGGIVITDNTLADFYTVRNSLNWKPIIAQKHSFDILGGTELRHRKYYTDYYKGYGFDYNRGMTASPDYRAIQRDLLSTGGSPYYGKGQSVSHEASFFANLAYTFNHKYNLTLSLRADGSNRLGASERFRFLPIWVAGASWNAVDENFLKDIKWLNNLKLRASYGMRGNISGLGSPELLAYYGTTVRFDPNTVENSITISAPDNPTMQWEKEKMGNVALELGVFERFSATLEYYFRKNYDLIGNLEVSRVSGFQRKTMNWADMKNEGFEFTLNTHNIKQKNFDWNTIFTFGYNRNTVTRMSNSNTTVLQATIDKGSPAVGYPVNGLYSFRFAGLDSEGLPQFYNARNEPTYRITKYYRTLSILDYEGSRDPLGSGGLTNSFRYKNLSLSFLFTYAYGNKIRLNPFFQRYYSDVEALDASLAQRWTAPGQEAYTNVPRIIEAETRSRLLQENADPFTFYNRSNIRVANGSFVRLKNVMLSYNVPSNLSKKIGLKSLQINGQAQNLVLWADPKLNGQDPEALVSGVSIPAATTYTLGLSVNF